MIESRRAIIRDRDGLDDVFAPQWFLSTFCADRTLWAVNPGHATRLRTFVTARIRPTVTGARPARWLIPSKYRDEVMRALPISGNTHKNGPVVTQPRGRPSFTDGRPHSA